MKISGPEYYNLTPEQDAEVEKLVDKRGISYHQARIDLGYASLANIQGPIEGPLSPTGTELDKSLHTGYSSDKAHFIKKTSLANMRGNISDSERDILYSRKTK